jgi:hypothetical protein
MQMLEDGDPARLQKFAAPDMQSDGVERKRRSGGAFRGFMRSYFANRNKEVGRRGPLAWLRVPAKNNRHLSAPNLYRDQAPVVEVRLRLIEIYYTGSELRRMRDEIVYSVRIPPFASGDSIPSIQ